MMISVIVPIYNAQSYLCECLDSICNQKEKDLEIILINDGSQDKSLQICQEYASRDNRIIVIDKANSGVSSSRNQGIKASSGDWIAFVDADDFLDINILKQARIVAEKNTNALIIWNATKVYSDHMEKCQKIVTGKLSKHEMISALISNYNNSFFLGTFFRAVWGKLFRADIIKSNYLTFSEDLYIGEDAVFIANYIKYIEDIVSIDSSGYYYRQLSSSAVRKFKYDLLEQSCLQTQAFEKIARDYWDKEIVRDSMNILHWEILRTLIYNSKLGYRTGKLKRNEKTKDARAWFERMKKSSVKKSKNDLFWARKLVRLQNRIGCGFPLWFHINLISFYDFVYGAFKSKTALNI